MVARRDDRAADDVAVAAAVLRRRVRDDVGAERERALQVRRGEGVVDDERPRPASCAISASAAMSAMPSSGLVGVSTQTIFVCPGRIAARTASTSRDRGDGVLDAPAAGRPC